MPEWTVAHLRVADATTGKPTPVRLRLVSGEGLYLPPLGRLGEFPAEAPRPVEGHLTWGGKHYAYIDGTCEVRLPAGDIALEIDKGPDYLPVRQVFTQKAGQLAHRFAIQRRSAWPPPGWYAGDVRVFGLSPRAAWLEGAAEGLNLVQVLVHEERHADGRRELAQILDFSAEAAAYMHDDTAVVVGTLNQDEALGRLALAHCHRVVFPLRLEDEGFENYTLHDWCRQAHRKHGLVIWPEFPANPIEAEALAILGEIDAVEWGWDDRLAELETHGQSAMTAWAELLSCGVRMPLVGGSGKVDSSRPVGALRTYAQLEPGQAFTPRTWFEAVKAGRTMVTRGPLLHFTAAGQGVGATLPADLLAKPLPIRVAAQGMDPGGRVVVWSFRQILAEAYADADGNATLETEIFAVPGGWLVAGCLGKNPQRGETGWAALTSPIYLGAHAGSPLHDEQQRALRNKIRSLDQLAGILNESTLIQRVAQLAQVRRHLSDAKHKLQQRLFSA
jgi:hypothetical protein